jgi:Cu+-exporting ATPase
LVIQCFGCNFLRDSRVASTFHSERTQLHREISHVDQAFHKESNLSLYFLTGFLALIIGADLSPKFVGIVQHGWSGLAASPLEIGGYRVALLAAILGGARVLVTSLETLFAGRLGADLALAIACIAAMLIREPLVAAEIVFIGMLGECLESFTFERTQRAVRHMVEVFPRRCWLLREGREVRVPISEVQVGGHVIVKPGGKVPVDGLVEDGRSAVDQSALTGESFPIDKGPGDEVLAGSLNQFGALTIEVRRVAENTVMGRVIELTARALKDKAPLERTADRLARYFLPAVLGLAAITFLVSLGLRWLTSGQESGKFGFADIARSIYPALSVLVVSCPCALILATPAAIIAALGRLAGTGTLLKGGSALERLAQIDAIAFDKTGTLTEGRLELGDVVPFNGTPTDVLLQTAMTAEQSSEHLVALLIAHQAAVRGLAPDHVEEFTAHPGAGVTARAATGLLVVGTPRFVTDQGVSFPSGARVVLEQLDAGGQTVVVVARDGVILGAIGVRDRLRPEAPGILNDLRDLGIKDIAILTGDRSAAAHAVAGTVGIHEVHAELLPEQKAEFITAWQALHKVAMVGDGINDAPSLARADVGLAIAGTGVDVAAEAGDIVLMGDPLRHLPLLVRLARETVRIIRQNIIVFAFAVNGVGIVLTAWLWPLLAPSAAWYEQAPLAAVIYHQLGSLAVLLNSMRLLWFARAPSPAHTRARQVFQRFDYWLGRYLDVNELVHWLEHHVRPVAIATTILVVVAYGLSGLTKVQPDELAVVRRFGRPVDTLEPGLHWRWPWPIEKASRVQPARVHTVEIGFRSEPKNAAIASALAWSSPHGGGGVRRVGEEAVMITGDGNLVELQATVRYIIRDAQSYLFSTQDPDGVIRAIAEASLRDAVAGQPFLELLTTNREHFVREMLARIRERCGGYGTLGIELKGLSLQDLHPPQEVVPAYHDVAKAMEARDRQVNDAEAEAVRRKKVAKADALRLVRQARAAAGEMVKSAEGDQQAFLTRQSARAILPPRVEWELFCEALREAWSGRAPALVYGDYDGRRKNKLAQQASLTDFRLYWDALARALTGRDKVIVDADNVPGRRHLLLLDPDQFRAPLPFLMPNELNPSLQRGSPSQGRGEGP